MSMSSVLPRFMFNRLHRAVSGVASCSPQSVAKTASRFAGVCLVAGALAACGGGGGSGPDRTPDTFNFTAQTDVALSSDATSPAVTITSISNNTPVSITGGEYSIDGGAFTGAVGSINPGQTLTVRATTSGDFSEQSLVNVTVGELTRTFSVTTLAQDTTPEAIAFTALTDAALNTNVTSNTVTITGINDAAPISIENGQYSINDGAFTAEAGTVSEGETVTVQVTSASALETAAIATVTVGGVASTFTVTTIAIDTTPDALSFAPVTDAEFGATVSSAMQTISGINSPAPISVTGGQYKINDNAFTSEAGTVNAGDVVVVSVVAGDTINAETSATITVGGEASVFNVTTVGDTTPPVAEVFFPTPTTFTDGSSVTVRGAATDDFGPISQISFTVSAANGEQNDPVVLNAEEGESLDTWMQSVPLITGQANTISIIAIDAAGNEQTDAVELSITQGNEAVTFPEGSTFSSTHLSYSLRLVHDKKNNRTIEIGDGDQASFLESGLQQYERLFTTNLQTGERSVFLEFGEGNDIPTDQFAYSIIIDPSDDDFVILALRLRDDVFRINLATKEVQQLSLDIRLYANSYLTKRDETSIYVANIDRPGTLGFFDVVTKDVTQIELPFEPNPTRDDNLLDFRYGFTVDVDTGIFYGLANNETLFSVDLSLPVEQQVVKAELGDLFANETMSGERGAFNTLSLDKKRNRLLLADSIENFILAVDLTTLEPTVLANATDIPVGANSLMNPHSLEILNEHVAIVYEDGTEFFEFAISDPAITLYLMDLETHERVVLSRSFTPAE